MSEEIKYCNDCKAWVTPEKKKQNFLLFAKDKDTCPKCGKTNFKSESDSDYFIVQKQSIDGNESKKPALPSVEDFLRFFNQKQYHKAIGLQETASAEEINARIDLFELEYLDRSSEWAIPLATIKQALVTKDGEKQGHQPEKTQAYAPKKIIIQDPFAMRKSMEFLAQAEKFEHMGNLKEAIDLCDKSIKADPHNIWAYKKRAWNCLLLPDYHPYLQQIIEDCTKVIELKPDDCLAHNDRGRAHARKGELDLASKDYHAAIRLEPSLTIAALNAMSVDICRGNYKDAIAIFGAWRPNVVSNKEQLIAESLIGIALTLDGKDSSKYQSALNNKSIKIRNMTDWCPDLIDTYLSSLKNEKLDPEQLKKAKEIQRVFRSHFQ